MNKRQRNKKLKPWLKIVTRMIHAEMLKAYPDMFPPPWDNKLPFKLTAR